MKLKPHQEHPKRQVQSSSRSWVPHVTSCPASWNSFHKCVLVLTLGWETAWGQCCPWTLNSCLLLNKCQSSFNNEMIRCFAENEPICSVICSVWGPKVVHVGPETLGRVSYNCGLRVRGDEVRFLTYQKVTGMLDKLPDLSEPPFSHL